MISYQKSNKKDRNQQLFFFTLRPP